MAEDPIVNQTVPTEAQARRVAKLLGCEGAHEIRDGEWHPCESHEGMMILIRRGAAGYRAWKERRRKADTKSIVTRHPVDKDVEERMNLRKRNRRKYRITRTSGKPKVVEIEDDDFEELLESGVAGIENAPGTGLTGRRTGSIG